MPCHDNESFPRPDFNNLRMSYNYKSAVLRNNPVSVGMEILSIAQGFVLVPCW